MDIGNRLRFLLEEKSVTQKELAKTLNLSATTLNGYIQNRREPDAKTMVLLASYFNTTTDYIYGVTSVKEPQATPYTADERHLVNIYRAIPEDKKPLFIEMGITFSDAGKNRQATRQTPHPKPKSKTSEQDSKP